MHTRWYQDAGGMTQGNEVNVSDVRRNLVALLKRVQAGEEIVILRYGQAVARLVPHEREPKQFLDLTAFRDSIKIRGESSHEALMRMRDEYRY